MYITVFLIKNDVIFFCVIPNMKKQLSLIVFFVFVKKIVKVGGLEKKIKMGDGHTCTLCNMSIFNGK